MISLIQKRVFDVSATLPRGVTVVFNNEKVNNEAGFEGYIKSFIPENNSILFLHPNSRWHIGITKRRMELEDGNENEEDCIMPESMSFVNNINTEKGGTHVDHVFDKIIPILKKVIDEKMENSGFRVKPANIKNHISIFINSLIENPSFESQTKETLTTKPKFFGSSFEVDQKKLINWANESGLIEEIMETVMNLKKKTKKRRVGGDFDFRDIVKLEDAILAGNKEKSQLCTLIVTEGDSAKALALSGLEILGREKFGVFPLKGKLINVSNLDEKKASENEEISTLMRIIGLKFDVQKFEEMNLRYGKLMILADQDEDGSHIKGLIINFIHKFWPDLLKNGFIQSFRTPLLKAKRGKEVHSFFNHQEFENWQNSEETSGKYAIKYYKGLGTSTSEEARQYFKDLEHHVIDFKYENSEDDSAIRMAFDREKSDDRKEWIKKYSDSEKSEKEINNNNLISYKEFVDEDLMKFGIVDLRRSIPCLIDGLKPSQRKILWTLLSMEESREMKVSQLSGAVSHSQSYHHGEESLVRTIIRMAQRFCGSSNLNLLEPIGQFGTRHENGNDAASARYIYTKLAPPTRFLFPPSDYSLLNRRFEDGQLVEPEYLCPIIPTVLINGVEGIGTGWNTRIMNRNLFEIIEMTRKMIEDSENLNEFQNILPFYEGHNGKIEKLSTNRFLSRGIARIWKPERKNSTSFVLEISELPIGMWTSKYKEKLQKVLENFDVIEFTEHHTEKKANFRIVFDRRRIKSAELLRKTNSELIKIFKLSSTMTENLVFFNSFGKLEEFENIRGIALQFFEIRKNLYEKRKEMLENQCLEKLKYAENQMRFIEMVTNGNIDLRKTNRFELEEIMRRMKLEKDPNKKKSEFGYLLEIPLYRLTPEEMNRLFERKNRKEIELDEIRNTNWKNIWMKELDRFENSVVKYRND
ncbi:unnamed protein product [Caenorhabditis angaria]|uniref:DNA topoisomerase 2 n=1 Tax=Caenorhabditis angaria TaxID=860376 RepID=A0A9P1N099_9PELO|nr:unnamed protein product [Caenorhabditis angaria]